MYDAANREGEFEYLHKDIANAISLALARYSKYYNFMDGLDIYYIALILNPWYKTRLIEQELKDDATSIIEHIKEVLHQEYPLTILTTLVSAQSSRRPTLEAWLLSKIHPSTSTTSDIDRYFNDPLA